MINEIIKEIEKDYKNCLDYLLQEKKEPEKFKEILKKISFYEEILKLKKEYDRILEKIREDESIIKGNEQELKEIAKEELNFLTKEKVRIEKEIEKLLNPQSDIDNKNAIVEIRAGIGGEEACLFVADLFRMYLKYCEKNNYEIEILNSHPSELGGFKEIIFYVKGNKVYGNLKYEGGVHRVQRVPKTESYGRIHTSAATVVVLPEIEDKEIKINPDDLKIETFRASGHGGQHVNKTSSAVRITHIPTGITVSCQDDRSQIKNRERAMKILRARLQDLYEKEKKEKIDTQRKNLVKTGDRSEKIRTYNFPQNRLTDHRINYTSYNLDKIMDGEIEELIEQLRKNLEEKTSIKAK
ncbi:MAG: peptide chain release factor 1 [Candidatus Omnitrophica bacterium]|nr:peptide chain release factor 1 [Candidatus Omnitrophota bacterium]MCM8809017.1 peptide chain release factor 1 [Candidatus Omnitrophota bacterium]MCM8810231.1 peptide chain release factor 1 [Candidatus Omnitrophota bacterium]MCM8833205.1 peptide chain release factor 1 [Candidatus Omnitrophota bacterium]